MDDMSEGADFLELHAPAPEELTIPPVLYAVPAATMGPLEQGQLVTVSVATGWLIDENFVVDGPAGAGDGESYDIASWVEYGAMQVRPHEQTTSDGTKVSVKVRPVPTTDLWVYRPAPGEHDLEDIPPWHPGLWFERVVEGGPPVTPPSPRRPRPARELPSLTGRRLYGPSFTPSGNHGVGLALVGRDHRADQRRGRHLRPGADHRRMGTRPQRSRHGVARGTTPPVVRVLTWSGR